MSSTPTVRSSTKQSVTTDLALIAFFAGLIAVCAIIPGLKLTSSGVPITLQTFAVLLAGAVLGWRRGFLAVLLYLVVGLAGLPIFSGGVGGLGVFGGPSIGYLLAFPLGAALCGFIVERLPRHKLAASVPLIFVAGLVSSFVFIHTLGIAGMMVQLDVGLAEAISFDLPFWPGDVIKNVCMAIVATAVHRAFPDLLTNRR